MGATPMPISRACQSREADRGTAEPAALQLVGKTALNGQLLGGAVANHGRVFRVGDTVRRPVAPFSPATHRLLRHLEAVGFTGSPRVLDVDRGTESLSWIPGRAAANPLPAWSCSDETLISVATLVRRFHDAVQDFELGAQRWPIEVPAEFRTGGISHNDLHPGNIIFAEGKAVGLIDFDLAGPGGQIWDLATTARAWCPLVADVDLPASIAVGDRYQRLALLLDAYGLPRRDRVAVVHALIANHDWTYRIVTDAARTGHRGFDVYWRTVAGQTGRARAWTAGHRKELLRAVG